MTRVFQLLAMFISLNSIGQKTMLRGTVYNVFDKANCPGALTYVDSIHGTVCNQNGEFELMLDSISTSDTIHIKFFEYRHMKITGLEYKNDTLDLGIIPMLGGFDGIDMTEFFCAPTDLECLETQRNYIVKREASQRSKIAEINQEFAKFNYTFNNRCFKPLLNDDYYHLVIIIDLSKPDH